MYMLQTVFKLVKTSAVSADHKNSKYKLSCQQLLVLHQREGLAKFSQEVQVPARNKGSLAYAVCALEIIHLTLLQL